MECVFLGSGENVEDRGDRFLLRGGRLTGHVRPAARLLRGPGGVLRSCGSVPLREVGGGGTLFVRTGVTRGTSSVDVREDTLFVYGYSIYLKGSQPIPCSTYEQSTRVSLRAVSPPTNEQSPLTSSPFGSWRRPFRGVYPLPIHPSTGTPIRRRRGSRSMPSPLQP